MIRYEPFLKPLCALVGYSVAYGGMTAFTVAFLKAETGLSEGQILLVNVRCLSGRAEQLCGCWGRGWTTWGASRC